MGRRASQVQHAPFIWKQLAKPLVERHAKFLFHGWPCNVLHRLDFSFLYYHRPIWDITVIFLSMGGFVLSATGIILTKRNLQKSFKKRRESLRWS
jgi:hypothetical protein